MGSSSPATSAAFSSSALVVVVVVVASVAAVLLLSFLQGFVARHAEFSLLTSALRGIFFCGRLKVGGWSRCGARDRLAGSRATGGGPNHLIKPAFNFDTSMPKTFSQLSTTSSLPYTLLLSLTTTKTHIFVPLRWGCVPLRWGWSD